MKTVIAKISVLTAFLLVCSTTPVLSEGHYLLGGNSEVGSSFDSFKSGQYVYVTLKDGSQTIAKIGGRKNLKKYYVHEIQGDRCGLVHKKHIRPISKEEMAYLKADKESLFIEANP